MLAQLYGAEELDDTVNVNVTKIVDRTAVYADTVYNSRNGVSGEYDWFVYDPNGDLFIYEVLPTADILASR